MTDLNSKIETAKQKVTSLQQRIDQVQSSKRDQTLAQTLLSSGKHAASIRTPPSIKTRRTLKGHFGKVTALHWGGSGDTLVSASQDGNLLVWNAKSSNKVQAISIKSSYVMSVGMEPTRGNLVACGGLDNLCTIYRRDAPEKAMEMASHDGFLSCCRFLNAEESILTASGDSTCIRWDIVSGKPVETFAEHTADAMYLALQSKNVFASASVDQSVKIWDIRTPRRSVATYVCHTSDVNAVEFLPSDSQCFATCSEDNTACVFDLRAANELARFGTATVNHNNAMDGMPSEGFTSLAVSKSGRLLFCGHAEGSVVVYDILADRKDPAYVLAAAHEKHVSCVGMSPNGDALATGSWDTLIKIWA